MSAQTWPRQWERPLVLPRVTALAQTLWFPVAVYLATRLVDAVLIGLAARGQIAITTQNSSGYALAHPSPAAPGYFGVATNWDGQWYKRIAESGYPTSLPHDATGAVAMNPLAFYPIYPLLVRLVMLATGTGFGAAAATLSLSLGLAGVVVMHELLRTTAGRRVARMNTALFCTAMAAPALQVAYTESVALLLICSTLLLLHRRRYGWVLPVLVLLALTRPVVVAMAPVVLWHGWVRHRQRDTEPFPRGERRAVVGLAVAATLLTGLWPLVTALLTHSPGAYLSTMKAWGAYAKLTPGTAWLRYVWQLAGPVGLSLLAVLVATVLALALRRDARPWGPEVRAWVVVYPLFLLGAAGPGPSIIRYLLLAFPLAWPFPHPAASRSEARARMALAVVLVTAGLLLQWVWVRDFLVVSSPPGHRVFP